MEAVWYGIVAALAFLGLVSIIYYVILLFYKPKCSCKYVIAVSDVSDKNEIGKLIYGSHIRSLIFGDLIGDGVVIINCGLDEESSKMLSELADEYGGAIICRADELNDCFKHKD